MATDPTQTESPLEHVARPSASSQVSSGEMADSRARCALPSSRRMRLSELGYEDIPHLSCLFEQTKMYPLLMDSPTRFIDVAAIVA